MLYPKEMKMPVFMFDLLSINSNPKTLRSFGYAQFSRFVSVKNLCHKIPAFSFPLGICQLLTTVKL
jgi:hypothetical protein